MKAVIFLTLASVAAIAACERAPRSADYFVAHQEDAAQVLARCASGEHRGEECVNAKAAEAETAYEARMDAYKRQRQSP